jgi:hypothetical protein
MSCWQKSLWHMATRPRLKIYLTYFNLALPLIPFLPSPRSLIRCPQLPHLLNPSSTDTQVANVLPIRPRGEPFSICLCVPARVDTVLALSLKLYGQACSSQSSRDPRPPQSSRITAVKERHCGGCGRKVTSISVGRISQDDLSRL